MSSEKQKHSILVVDDHEDIRVLLDYMLTKEGYKVRVAKDGKDALKKMGKHRPDLVILDVMMPVMDGLSTCRTIRKQFGTQVLVLFLTAREDEYSEVAGFEAGADDYIAKPIKTMALVHRVRKLLNRKEEGTEPEEEALLHIGPFVIDAVRYILKYKGEKITLRKKEFELICFLAKHPGHYFSREKIMNKIWGNDIYVTPRTVDVHIRRIREKIGKQYIATLSGIGYAFKAS